MTLTIPRRHPPGDSFRVEHRCTRLHPMGLYHVYHRDAEIGRLASHPSLDDCEGMLRRLRHPGETDIVIRKPGTFALNPKSRDRQAAHAARTQHKARPRR